MEEVTNLKCPTNVFGCSYVDMVEYVVHVVEMMVAIQGVGAKSVRIQKSLNNDNYLIDIVYGDERNGTISYCKGGTYHYFCEKDGQLYNKNAETDSFVRLTTHIINFFENDTLPFDTAQTLEVMKIRDAILKARENIGELIEV